MPEIKSNFVFRVKNKQGEETLTSDLFLEAWHFDKEFFGREQPDEQRLYMHPWDGDASHLLNIDDLASIELVEIVPRATVTLPPSA